MTSGVSSLTRLRVAGLGNCVVVCGEYEVHLAGDYGVDPLVADDSLADGLELGHCRGIGSVGGVSGEGALLVGDDRDKRGAVRGGDVGGVGDLSAQQGKLDLAGDDLVLKSFLSPLERRKASAG